MDLHGNWFSHKLDFRMCSLVEFSKIGSLAWILDLAFHPECIVCFRGVLSVMPSGLKSDSEENVHFLVGIASLGDTGKTDAKQWWITC
jgi:hypothetical protein